MAIIKLTGFRSHKTPTPTEFDFPIAVSQRSGRGLFNVKYGVQLAEGLTYAEAAKHLGECVFHALAAAGEIENR